MLCFVLVRIVILVCYVFFFFKQKTAYEMRISDWSSDVCSSDLVEIGELLELRGARLADDRARLAGQPVHGQENLGVDADGAAEIGRASCRERVCQYV